MSRFGGLAAICLGVLLCAGGAGAQNDIMCFCADSGSASTCGGNLDVAAFEQVTLYFCLLEPSEPQVLAWEAYLEIDGEENLVGTWTVLGEQSINFGSETEFVVGAAAAPLRPNSANLVPLLSMNAIVMDETPIRFYIKPVPGSLAFPDLPGYAPAVDDPLSCEPCGIEGLQSFSINFETEDEDKAWGEVKTLYGQ